MNSNDGGGGSVPGDETVERKSASPLLHLVSLRRAILFIIVSIHQLLDEWWSIPLLDWATAARLLLFSSCCCPPMYVYLCRRPSRFEKKKKFKESFLLSSKREEKFYCVRVDGDAKRLDVKSLYTVSNTHTLYRAARLYYDVITFQFDVCVRLGYGNIFFKKKEENKKLLSFYFLLGSRYALIISFRNNNNNKKRKKTFFECFFSGIIFFLKRRVKNPGRAHSSLRINVAPCAHLNGNGKRESTQSSERWWRFNLPPRSWQMLQSCRVSSFNFLFSLFKKKYLLYIFNSSILLRTRTRGGKTGHCCNI